MIPKPRLDLLFLRNPKTGFLLRDFSLISKVCDPSRSHLVAVIDPSGSRFTYGDLDRASSSLARKALNFLPSKPTTIACYHSPGSFYVISSLAAWKLGATLVPLSPAATQNELQYFLADSGAELVLSSGELVENLYAVSLPKVQVSKDVWLDCPDDVDTSLPPKHSHGAALIIYTSGTTGKPKGVVHSHDTLYHMIRSLTVAWQYSDSDKILHFLPLHHLHGILNKLWCVLNAGGTVEFLKSANAVEIWKRLSDSSRLVTLFMAVPTIYAKMIAVQSQGELPREIFDRAIENMQSMRVMVSGSASLPLPILQKWRDLSGHHLLERYGMTEVGMALSNPLVGERREGFVGSPLPFVECKIVPDSEFHLDDSAAEGACGELCLKGPTLFKHYHNRPQETLNAFDSEGWFRTGDIALRQIVDGKPLFKILGRNSTDIIKSAGYKLSALEIERELLSHPLVREAAVIGVEDEMFGQIVGAIIVSQDTAGISTDDIQSYLKTRLAAYKLPRIFRVVRSIPKNQLGKVNKKTLWKDLQLQRQ